MPSALNMTPTGQNFLSDESKVNADMGIVKIYNLHVNRILHLSTLPGSDEAILNAVEFFDAAVDGDKDMEYEKDMSSLNTKIDMVYSRNTIALEANPSVENDIKHTHAVLWFKIVMRLMKRKGFTPRTQWQDVIA
jgi:hypothetical protein